MWLMHWLLYFSLITDILYSCNRTVGCNRTPVIGQLKQPIIISPLSQIYQSQANHRIITIATTTYPTNLVNFQNGGIFYIRQCFYRRCFPNVNFELFPPFFAQSDNCSLVELSSSLEETQPTVASQNPYFWIIATTAFHSSWECFRYIFATWTRRPVPLSSCAKRRNNRDK